MSYRIVYGPDPVPAQKATHSPIRLRMLTAVFLLLFALLVRQWWPQGHQLLSGALLPDGKSPTQNALTAMVAEIGNGEPVLEALSGFCRQIIDHEPIR